MKPPTHIFKDFLTQPVPLSCPKAAVIGRSIAFDGEHVTSRLIRMANRKIIFEPCRSNLFVDLVPKSLDEIRHGLFKRGVRILGRRDLLFKDSRLSILQKSLEDPRSFTPRSIEIDVSCCERCKDLAATARPREQHVQASLAPLARNRTKGHPVETCAWDTRPVADRNEDDIAFVTLHVFKVLHENVFGLTFLQ